MPTCQNRFLSFFLWSASFLLFFTALAKLVSAAGNSRILFNIDPLFNLSFRHVLCLAASVELIIAILCLFCKSPNVRAGLIAWLSSMFLVYRSTLFFTGYQHPCECLGNLTDALLIKPELADNFMKALLIYLLVGSYTAIFWLSLQRHKSARIAPSFEKTPDSAL
jgi:hypothetical protein